MTTKKMGVLSLIGFGAGFIMTSMAFAQEQRSQLIVRPGSYQVGQEVRLYRIKDDCRWPSTVSVDHPQCREPLGAGKVIQRLDSGNVLIQSSSTLDESTQVEDQSS